jgi:DNA-binding NarL/FixJ family response regulator
VSEQAPERTNGEITCLIVDDHEVVREGLRLSLSRAPHIRVVGEAADGATAVALAERRKPDVVIMDVRMPGMDGLEATKILTQKVPDAAVLIFTAYSERSLLGRGLESGAKGYILKEAPHQTLLKAIEKVVAGEGFVDPALMPAFLSGDREEMLTAREREILQLLADGMSNADVAGRLFISQETVKSHVRHILTKLEADTRTHAVAIALRDAIIDEGRSARRGRRGRGARVGDRARCRLEWAGVHGARDRDRRRGRVRAAPDRHRAAPARGRRRGAVGAVELPRVADRVDGRDRRHARA